MEDKKTNSFNTVITYKAKWLNRLYIGFIIILSFGKNLHSQEILSQGFEYLEQSQFEKATTFFEEYLVQDPKNKVARICYGRALGLNGNAELALNIFETLKQDYPADLEIQLNLGEGYLWNSQPEKSIQIFKSALIQNPDNLTSNLGLANAYAESGNYAKAFSQIRKALSLNPAHPSIQQSYLSIGLARAHGLREIDSTHASFKIFDLMHPFSNNPKLITSKAISYLHIRKYKKALELYLRLIPDNNNLEVSSRCILCRHDGS